MKLLLCVVLIVAACVKAQQDDAFPDYWQNDYDSFYDAMFNDDDAIDAPKANDPEEKFLSDYQIEDNRADSPEKLQPEESENVDTKEEVNEEGVDTKEEDLAVLPVQDLQENNEEKTEVSQEAEDVDDFWGDVVQHEVEPLQLPSSSTVDKDIIEETREILNEDSDNFEDKAEKETKKTENLDVQDEPEKVEGQQDIDQIIEETNKLLEETDDAFEANDYGNSDEQDQEKSEEDVFSENNEDFEEDTVDKVYADLNADLDQLFETLNKLSDDDDDNDASDTAEDNNEYADNVQEYEEKYGKPYKEDAVLSWRNAEMDAEPDDNDEDGADEDLVKSDENDGNSFEENDGFGSQEKMDDYENVDDSNLHEIFAEHSFSSSENKTTTEPALTETTKPDENTNTITKESAKSDEKEVIAEENTSNDEKGEIDAAIEDEDEMKDLFEYMNNYDDSEPNADDDIDSVIKQIFSDDIKEPQSYGNDGLIDDTQPKNEDAKEFESIESTNSTKVEENIEQQTIMVDDLTSAELEDLTKQFMIAHSEDLDIHSESFAKHVAPIHVTLSVDEPTVITSPNYPSPYPTNNIIDWILEGPGMGIEMNITSFAVNGAIGDYLLLKPGGLDESGQDGLVFTYRLRSERRYRFTDVNRMFVRFEAKPGFQFLTGFSFSVKMIWPLPQMADDIPEAEPVVKPPEETLTISLAGLTLAQFTEVKGDFVELIADMASAYIRDKNIDRGLNTTLEVTQITRTAVCNIHWPNYETCVEITFGVPLQYEEETDPRLNAKDLDSMWNDYIVKEEFASRLISLGVTEYAIPNDRSVVMVWVVIAFGVLISMAMLAFALWRFSCFEDYTRMKAYNDTDSIRNEKRNLDLYPTPHQTLPPLYTENDYKWVDEKYDDSTRVDIGGFANKSYVRDELFDLDSDEDVITTRDRKGVISPRDIYDV